VRPRQTSHADSGERGSAILEFALSAIVLFTLLFGTITLAMAAYTYEVVNQYARDASRYAIVHGNGCSYVSGTTPTSCSIATGCSASGSSFVCTGANSALKTYLNNEIYPGINGNTIAVATTYGKAPSASQCSVTDCNGSGDQVAVTVSYNFLYAIPFIPQRSFTMHASSTMVISQ
jgi:Flp pilus assembly protein TadG